MMMRVKAIILEAVSPVVSPTIEGQKVGWRPLIWSLYEQWCWKIPGMQGRRRLQILQKKRDKNVIFVHSGAKCADKKVHIFLI